MQRGSLEMVSRKEGPAVWQFRWSEKDLHGIRVQRKRVIGTVERYQDEGAARSAVTILLQEINSHKVRMGSRSITIASFAIISSNENSRRKMPGAVTQPRRPTMRI
jgi:hypothetical protein